MLTLIPLLLTAMLLWTAPAWATITVGSAVTAASGGTGATTIAAPAITLTAGQGVEVCVKWEGAGPFTLSGIASDKGDTATLQTTQQYSGGQPSGRCGHVTSVVGGSTIFTATFSGAAAYRRIHVYPITYTGTLSLDVQSAVSVEDNADYTPSSAAVTATGTDEVCFGFQADFNAQAFSLETINGIAADGRSTQSDTDMWYKIFTAGFTGASSLTRSQAGSISFPWVQRLACLKAAGGVVEPPPATTGNTYYVSLTGSDSNSCTAARTITTPKRTFASAVPCVQPGDTLYIRSGTWTEQLNLKSRAGSAGLPLTFAGFPGERPCLTAKNGQGGFAIYGPYDPPNGYVTIRNLVMDASCDGTLTANLQDGAGWTLGNGNAGGSPHDILIDDVEIMNWKGNGIQLSQGTSNVTIQNSHIHDTQTRYSGNNCTDTVGTEGRWYGLYIHDSINTVVQNNEINDNMGGGLHIYPGPNINTIVRRNSIHDNNKCHNAAFGGILLQNTGSGMKVYENLIYNNGSDSRSGNSTGIMINGPSLNAALIANNTVYANGLSGVGGYGIALGTTGVPPVGTILSNNHVVGNGLGQIGLLFGSTATQNTNRTSGTLTDCTVSTSTFTQKAGSSCIGQGTAVSGLAYNGSAPEQGTYETFAYSSATVNQNLLDVSLGMNLNTPVRPATGITGFTVACSGSNCGTPVVASASRLTGADSVVRLSLTGIGGGSNACAVGQTWTVTYAPGNVTDSSFTGVSSVADQPLTAFTTQAVTNACGTAPPSQPAGVTISYTFDEGTGTSLTDGAGGDQNGTLTNGVAWTTGKFGNAVSFTAGTNQYVAIAYGTGLDPSASSWTDCMGLDPTAGLESTLQVMFGTANGTNQRMYIGTMGGTWSQGVQAAAIGQNTEFPVGTGWSYVCQVVDSTADTVTLYVNGVPGTSNQSIKSVTSYVLASDFRIGQQGTDVTAGVVIDEYRHFPTALSAANISTLYAIWEPPTPPPVGTLSQVNHQFLDAFYQTGTSVETSLSAVGAANTSIHSGIPFTLAIQTDCTVADCDPLSQKVFYSRTPLATGVPSAFIAVPDIAGPDQIAFYGQTADSTVLHGAVATCLSGALAVTAGTTVQSAAAIPVFDLPINGCTTNRYVLQLGVGAVLGDIYTFKAYSQSSVALSAYTPSGGAKLTVTPVANISAPTGLHLTGASSNTIIELVWTPNTDATLAGYKGYQCSTSPCTNANGTLVFNHTPATALAGHYSLTTWRTNISVAGTYYFVVTAYDTGGQESSASGELAVVRTGPVPRTQR